MTARLLLEALAIGQVLLAIGTAVAVLADRRYRASSAISWLLLIAAIPLAGAALYWLAGKPWLSRRRLTRSERIRASLSSSDDVPKSLRIRSIRAALARMPEGTRGLAVLAGQVSGQPPVGGNEVEFLADTADLMHRIASDIDAAKDSVHVLFYIALDDDGGLPVMEAMMRAAERGVKVRFLVDSLGSRPFTRSATRRRMEEAGVHVVEALAAGLLGAFFERIDLRNHRKIVVIDGKIGYIGSHNLAAATFKVKKKHLIWVDATCRLEGPIANELQRVFAEDWSVETMERLDETIRPSMIEEGGVLAQVVATGPLCDEGSMPQVLVTCIHLAQREIVLTTPYFVPDEPTMVALIGAARRGVRVRLVVPEHNDSKLVYLASKSFFGRLLEAGVSLLEFKGGMLHAKTITIDDRLSVMTSSNLDRRSFEINFEVSLLLYDQYATQAMRNLQESYIERSIVITREEWAKRPRWKRILENAVGLASPVL
ncbi:MAG: cardiolipin synthase [Phycisphaerae bacterium]|nr:cardiolipin synthase [Phycisphaerae bacterium]